MEKKHELDPEIDELEPKNAPAWPDILNRNIEELELRIAPNLGADVHCPDIIIED